MPNIRTKTAEGAPSADGGSITGYASTWTREPDFYGDVVAKGAFSASIERIEAEGRTLPLLWNHDADDLKSYIGTVTGLAEDDHGLLFTATFDSTPEAQRARELAMDGRLCKFSFAYDVIDQMEVELEDGRKANELRQLDVHEVSLVMYPANPDTSVVEVKGAEDGAQKAVGTAYIDLVPRVKGLDEQQFADFTSAIAEAVHRGVEVGLKAGRRNSKADEDAIRQAIALLQSVLGDEPEDDNDEPETGDGNDADDADSTTEGGEGEATPKGREDESEDIEAYRKQALISAHKHTHTYTGMEGYHA